MFKRLILSKNALLLGYKKISHVSISRKLLSWSFYDCSKENEDISKKVFCPKYERK